MVALKEQNYVFEKVSQGPLAIAESSKEKAKIAEDYLPIEKD